MNVPDLVLVAVLALAALVGAFRGLVRMLWRLASLVVSFLAFFLLAPPIAAWIAPWPVFDGARADIARFLLDHAPSATSVESLVASLGLPAALRDRLLGGVPDSLSGAGLPALADRLAADILVLALTAAVGLALVLVASILLWLATETVEAVLKKAKFLDGVNHLAGALLGFAEAALTVLFLLAGLAFAATFLPQAAGWLADTTLLAWAYAHNPLLLLLPPA